MNDLTTIDSSGAIASAPRAFLALLGEARRELIPLVPNAELSIGRSRSCHVVVEGAEASRLQATVHWDGARSLWLTDRGSRNGTFVSGRRAKGRIALRAGDIIRVGETRMVVVIEQERAPKGNAAPVAVDGAMQAVVERVEAAARSVASVLLVGETGVGKEVLANHLHEMSDRRQGPFIAINCGAIPETLAESVLFGHERGAFTGAQSRQPGVFEAASGGSLFLDEVGELSQRMQARLLRVLETKEVTRVGATESFVVDVRLVSATHRDLRASDRFRPDLFYRLAVVTLQIPPLRDRPDDIEAFVNRFVQELAPASYRIAAEVMTALQAHPWPGNVRELRNVLEAAIALGNDKELTLSDLPLGRTGNKAPSALDTHLEDVERDRIADALEACDGNQSAAARRLGISRRALIYRMEKHGLKPLPPSAT